MNVGLRIKEARKAQKLTQKQLADKMGVAEVTIRQYEAGRRAISLDQLEKVAASLDTAIMFFIDGKTPDEPALEYERICDTLNAAGFDIDEAGVLDEYIIKPTDNPDGPEACRRISYSRLVEIVDGILADAEKRKTEYIQTRLSADLYR